MRDTILHDAPVRRKRIAADLAHLREVDAGREAIVAKLLRQCLRDPAMCRLLAAHADGIIQYVPPLREINLTIGGRQ